MFLSADTGAGYEPRRRVRGVSSFTAPDDLTGRPLLHAASLRVGCQVHGGVVCTTAGGPSVISTN